MALNCTLVDIDSMFYTSVQGTYFYQVIFGTKFKFSENQSTLRFHYSYRGPSILLRSRHYGLDKIGSENWIKMFFFFIFENQINENLEKLESIDRHFIIRVCYIKNMTQVNCKFLLMKSSKNYLIFFTCILPHYVAHDITKEF